MSRNVPPGPDGAPFIGSLLPYLSDRLGFLEECAEYGDVVRRTIRGSESYLLFHPDHVERVLLREDDKFLKAQFGELDVEQSCGSPVIDPRDHPWEERFEAMNPAFKRDVIDTYVDVMARVAAERVESLEYDEPVDVLPRMKDLVVEITVKTLFGEHRVADERRISRAYRTVSDRLNTSRRIVPLWAPTPGNWRAKRSGDFLYGMIEEMIAAAREDDRESDSLLSVMLAASERDDASDEYLRDELLTLMAAAHETTAMALGFTCHLVAKRPDVQRRLQAEADRVLGDDLPGPADLPRLSFTRNVAKEALRLYPPVFATNREAKTEVTFDGYTIPAGGRIFLPQWVVHRDGRWYDDPDSFVPERWTREFERELPDFAYFPFSGGPKQCIGRTFAMVEMEVILATMARRVDLELLSDDELEVQTAFSLKPKNGIEVIARPRNG